MKQNKSAGLSIDQLLAQWQGITQGVLCGCPLCCRDLLDEMAQHLGKLHGADRSLPGCTGPRTGDTQL